MGIALQRQEDAILGARVRGTLASLRVLNEDALADVRASCVKTEKTTRLANNDGEH